MRRHVYPCLGLTGLALLSITGSASDPASQDVIIPTTPGQSVVVEWVGTVNPGASGAATNSCTAPTTDVTDDHHVINLTAPAGAYGTVNVSAAFHIEWDTAGSDMVLTVTKDGAVVASSDGGTPEENVVVNNPKSGAFDAIACPFAVTTATPYRGKLTLTATAASTATAPLAGPGNATGLPPRFQNYAPDYPKQGFGMFGGESQVDINPNTGSIFYLGFLETMRLKLDDSTSPALQTWELKSGPASSKSTSDPILVGDPATGRIFAMQLAGGDALLDYTDDDGETWTSGIAGGVAAGPDHQTMGVGPYPLTPPGSLIPHPLYPNAIYYCSQAVADANCSRSDDGGKSFGPSVTIYSVGDCQGLHGHVKVAPDGTAYVPVAGCPSPLVNAASSQPAAIVSTDAGVTWAVRPISTSAPGSGGHGSDPSIGIARDNTMYYSYVSAADNHIHMAVSKDRGITWINDVDIGALAGITKAQFPAVVAGDPDRAAVSFFGSTFTGKGVDTANNFPGVWHLYIATTYDGGRTYHVVNATPGDPIQRGGICGSGFCRNLLDFMDAVIDPQGRIVASYEDGCVGGCPLGSSGTFSDQVVIARQSGGRRLLAAFDPVEPAKPGAPRLMGYRTQNFVQLEWPAVDDNASAVTEYKVYRGKAAGAETLLQSVGLKQQFVDAAASGDTVYYRVSAVNALGESLGNELALKVGDNAPTPAMACTLPGLQVAADRTGEPEAQPPTRDIAAVYMAEPEDLPGKLVITIKVVEAAPPNQGGAVFHAYFDLPNGGKRYRVTFSETTSGYGTLGPDPDTGVNNTYLKEGDLEPESAFNLDGTVQMVLSKEKLGLKTGDTLLGLYADTFPGPASLNVTVDEAGYTRYKLVGNDFCKNGGVVTPPVAAPLTGTGLSTSKDAGRFGGALGLGLLLSLMAAGALRYRSK